MSMSDAELLQRYVEGGSHAAFTQLVQRHVDLVYSVARRHVGSNQLAEDVAQAVFLDLARNAARVKPGTPLIAWLHLVSRRTAIDAIRRESRRRAREHQAAILASAEPAQSAMPLPSPEWAALEPLLDEAVEALPPADRTAILLRFFENKSLREVGTALGASDDAAQKRVTRALDQLRSFFLRRGIATTSAALAADLSAHGIFSAPAALGTAISSATATTALAGVGFGAAHNLAMTSLQKTLVAGAFVLTAGIGLFEASVLYRQHTEIGRLERHSRHLTASIARTRSTHASLAAQLTEVETQIDTRLASARAARPGSGPDDAALEQQIRNWLNDAGRLKDFVAARPHLATPELRLLSDDQWAEIASQGASAGGLDTEAALLRAAALARQRAQNLVAPQLQRALAAYLKVSANVLPDSLSRLQPYLVPPIVPELLTRYELLHAGNINDLSPRDRSTGLIATRSVVDREHDAVVSIGIQGWTSHSANSPRALPSGSRPSKP